MTTKNYALWLALSLLLGVQAAQGRISATPDRTPKNQKILGWESYQPLTITQVANPRFTWVNLQFAAKLGFDVSPQGLTPMGEADLKQEVAYANRSQYERESAFTPV